MLSFPNKNFFYDILLLIFFGSIIFFIFLGERPLSIPDEGNYAEIAREMFFNKDYFTPYLNGIKFFEKPVLLYWLGVGISKLLGFHIGSLRAVNASLALLGCLLTYMTARQLYDRKTGLFSACILATSMLYFILAHMYTMDLAITVFIAATLYTFILGATIPKKRFFYFIISAISAALGVLTKGLMGIVLPLMIIFVWMSVFKEWKLLRLKEMSICLMIFIMIALPWHLIVTYYNPEFLHFYFIEHHFSRFSSAEVGHLRPFWYYIPVVGMGLFPWIVFLPFAILQSLPRHLSQLKEKKVEIFLSSYAAIIFLFFTFSKAKLIPYVLPIFPPLSILIARYLKNEKSLKKNYFILFIFSLFLAISCVLFTKYWQVADLQCTNLYLRIIAGIALIGSLIGLFFSEKNPQHAIFSTIFMGAILGMLLMLTLPKMDRLTIYPLTQIVKPILQNNDEVVSFNHHYQDLSFYLERQVNILNSRKLFSFGMKHQKYHEWMINDYQFNKLWLSATRVFAIMDIEQYQKKKERYQNLTFYLWGETSKNVLVSNVPKS